MDDVWFSPIGCYFARVVRTDLRCDRQGNVRYTGRLELVEEATGKVRRVKDINLAFSDNWGPDYADIREWHLIATTWAEELDK